MNGKSVEVDNTDAEGRLILSGTWSVWLNTMDILHLTSFTLDALYYTSTVYKPHTLIDLATLTGYVFDFLNLL